MLKGTPDAAGPELQAAAAKMGVALPPEVLQAADAPVLDLWADHWPAVRLFAAMQTQLRVSPQGVEGFDYGALPVVERRLGLSPRQARQAFEHLRVMEAEMVIWHAGS